MQKAKFQSKVKEHFNDVDVEVVVRKRRAVRSVSLNNYYFGVVVRDVHRAIVSVGNEWNVIRVHEYLKHRFLPENLVLDFEADELMLQEKSTKLCTNEEFMEYIERIIRWAAAVFEIQIMYPDEKLPSLNR